jgi:hypothetical protein
VRLAFVEEPADGILRRVQQRGPAVWVFGMRMSPSGSAALWGSEPCAFKGFRAFSAAPRRGLWY